MISLHSRLLAELAEWVGYIWDKSIGRYRDRATGRLVSERTLLDLGTRYMDEFTRPNVQRLTERMIAGKLDLASWQTQVARELKIGHINEMLIGRGGRAAVTAADYGRVGGHLRFEYRHLDGLAQEIKAGLLSDAQIKMRIDMYVNGLKMSYAEGVEAAKVEAGYRFEQWFLGEAEHCEDCVAFAGQGRQPIGAYPTPGDGHTRCLHNCACHKEYFRE